MAIILKGATPTVTFKLIASSDHLSKLTGGSPTVNISKNGGTFSATTNAAAEVANGWYKVALTATETNTAGDISYYITCASADDTDFRDQVLDPATANLGVNLVNIAGSAVSTSAAQLGVNAVNIAGQAAALDANNYLKVDVVDIAGTASAATAGYMAPDWAHISAPTTTVDLSGTTIKNVDNAIATVTTVTNQLTAAQIATGIWTDITASDFTTASSIGKSVMNGVSLGTGLKIAECVLADTVTTYTGNTPQTGDSYARIGAAGAGLTAITGVTLAATQTGVTIPTVTNVTNAPGAGDFTATMKTSIGTAVAASAVASVTAPVAITSNVKKNQALAKFQFVMTDSTTHAPKTGVTVTCTRSVDNGAFGAGTLANIAELSNGVYTVDFGAGDLNGNVIILRATGASSDDTFERIVTQP